MDDDAQIDIAAADAPFTGSFRPEGDLGLLEGETLTGTWTLEITDDQNNFRGSLLNWALIVEHV